MKDKAKSFGTEAERELNILNCIRGKQGQSEDSETPEIRVEFENEAEERAFWETYDSTKFIDWSEAIRKNSLIYNPLIQKQKQKQKPIIPRNEGWCYFYGSLT